MVCNALVAGGRRLGAGQQAMRPGWGKLLIWEWNNNWLRAVPGPMHLGFKTDPLCPIFCIKLKGALFLQQSSRCPPPFLIPNYLPPPQKNGNPAVNVEVTLYSCVLLEFHLTGALRRILTEVPSCGTLLRLWIILNLDPAGSGEIFGPPSRAPILGKAKYNWEVARYPRGCRWRQTHPLPFIP